MKHFSRLVIFLCLLTTYTANGQSVLSKKISIDINQQRVADVLEILSNQGDFYFSYNSNIIKKDSIVSFKANNKTVKEILTGLFNNTYEFKESGNYIIIRRASIRLTLVTNKGVTEEKIYSVSGYVYDEQSGAAINEASIYEKRLLYSALTNNDGFFKLKLKSSKASVMELTVSKAFYEDTTVAITPRYNQQLTITMIPQVVPADVVIITPQDYLAADSILKIMDTIPNIQRPATQDSLKIEKTSWAKLLLSGKQKVQSLNLNKFFTTRPVQVSFVPALGTHGKMSAQVVNNFSLNILGGYTAGTNGLEVGGLFNIDKKAVKYLQAAGLFNAVGGTVSGLQIAGVSNLVLDSVKGLQAAGVNNHVKGSMHGLQLAGVYNHVTKNVSGMQVAGVGNFVALQTTGLQIAGVANVNRKHMNGVQIAGVANVNIKKMDGVQIAGVVNYTKKLTGLQIGLINIADTSSGYSIGLINIVFKGYHKLSFSTNEVISTNLAFKTGNSKLYSILQGGINVSDSNKIYAFGYGIGSELSLNKKKTLSINPELSAQYLYLGSWDYTNILNRVNLNFTVKLGRFISIYAGPSYSVYYSNQNNAIAGYRFPVPASGFSTHQYSNQVTGWFGWNAGLHLF
ncbi:hypothetical protein BH11BAC3_BH11BAC3_05910 [soil metagenome]